jgi:D-alanine--poly(phosphoribitol) ligase subunit 2
VTQDAVVGIIVRLLTEMQESGEVDLPDRCDLDTPLFGPEGVLDSMGLVSLVVALEQALEREHTVTVSLADEHALSQRRSPYRTVGTLADYAVQAAVASR